MGESLVLGQSNAATDEDGQPIVYSLIPDQTMLEAEVLNIERQKMPFQDKETGEDVFKMNFKFKVTEDGEYFDRYAWGQTSTSFVDHPGCRLRAWISEILGSDSLPEGFNVNTDDLLDMPCRVIVAVRKYKDKNGEQQERNYVQDVLRPAALSNSVWDNGEEPF